MWECNIMYFSYYYLLAGIIKTFHDINLNKNEK